MEQSVKRRRLLGKQSRPPLSVEGSSLPLPIPCLLEIARFSGIPPAIYALCLCCKAFHKPNQQGVVATALLGESLRSSLCRVLAFHKLPLSAVAFEDLRKESGPGAVLSGSTMVQVVLGTVWKDSDIDIFCTAEAAPVVRTKLVKSGFTLARMHDDYKDAGGGMLSFLLESNVHHVEGWAVTPKEGEVPKALEGWSRSPEPFSFSESCEYGTTASDYFYDSLTSLLPFKVPRNQEIVSLPGEALSYNFMLTDRLDLVVAQLQCRSALDLLKSFDILLCAASYDGARFHIPHPHKAFRGISPLEPKRLKMMSTFAQEWKKLEIGAHEPFDFIEELLSKPRVQNVLQHAGVKGSKEVRRCDQPEQPQRYYWNFFARLFQRQRKYATRGVKLEGAPTVFSRIGKSIRLENVPIGW